MNRRQYFRLILSLILFTSPAVGDIHVHGNNNTVIVISGGERPAASAMTPEEQQSLQRQNALNGARSQLHSGKFDEAIDLIKKNGIEAKEVDGILKDMDPSTKEKFKAYELREKDPAKFAEQLRGLDDKQGQLTDYQQGLKEAAKKLVDDLPVTAKEIAKRTGLSMEAAAARLHSIGVMEKPEDAAKSLASLMSSVRGRNELVTLFENKGLSHPNDRIIANTLSAAARETELIRLKGVKGVDRLLASAEGNSKQLTEPFKSHFDKAWDGQLDRIQRYVNARDHLLVKQQNGKYKIDPRHMATLQNEFNPSLRWMLAADIDVLAKMKFDQDAQQSRFFIRGSDLGLKQSTPFGAYIVAKPDQLGSLSQWAQHFREDPSKLRGVNQQEVLIPSLAAPGLGAAGIQLISFFKPPVIDIGSEFPSTPRPEVKGEGAAPPIDLSNMPAPASALNR